MTKKIKVTPYDTADYLKTEADIQGYMREVLKYDDPELFAYALGTIARARGMSKVAKKAGLSRESLYKALSKNRQSGIRHHHQCHACARG